ncbi:MAG: hypothetical protein NWE99_10950 [Candidatus Bathyarchaeota archaeon]|nr:hypothetical protein [Candidatus Bathyarchaeota archaeon]
MERQVELSGKEFASCQGCPALLGFNWQRSKGRDVVYVVCQVTECILQVEKEVKR